MKVYEYLKNLPGFESEIISWTDIAIQQTEEFITHYRFIQKDNEYCLFISKIGGAVIANSDYIFIIYGFALTEPEIVLSKSNYLNEIGYLGIGEYVDKKDENNWKGIGYSYHTADHLPIIYARFSRKSNETDPNHYYPLCIGFENFIKICTTKNYSEQINITIQSNRIF